MTCIAQEMGSNESFIDLMRKAYIEALNEGIKANTIVINKNMVKVQEFGMKVGGHGVVMPPMFCGLNVYLTKDELPEGYSFALIQAPDGSTDRLAEFESIGMEPEELRKAAELYRKIKEVV